MNRGSQRRAEGERVHVGPSMRPRFMNRGSVIIDGYPVLPDRAFNEAPIHESGKSMTGTGYDHQGGGLQ